MLIQGHEKSIHQYAQGDEQIDEWIKDDERQELERIMADYTCSVCCTFML